jgi:hypothetical protein
LKHVFFSLTGDVAERAIMRNENVSIPRAALSIVFPRLGKSPEVAFRMTRGLRVFKSGDNFPNLIACGQYLIDRIRFGEASILNVEICCRVPLNPPYFAASGGLSDPVEIADVALPFSLP